MIRESRRPRATFKVCDIPMNFNPASIKEHIAHNRAKSLLLAVLTVLMIGLFVRAVVLTSPRRTRATLQPAEDLTAAPVVDPKTQSDLEQRIRESNELWQALNDNHGLAAERVCRFDPRFYRLDPARQEAVGQPPVASDPAPLQSNVAAPAVPPPAPADPAPRLVLQFTMLGTNPSALINSRVVHVGDVVEGYRVVRIEAVSVTLERDGNTYPLNMAKPDQLTGNERSH